MRIIDSAVPDFPALQELILAVGFPWYYARQTKPAEGQPVNPFLHGWVHMVFDNGVYYSEFADKIFAWVRPALVQAGESVSMLHRIRIVLNVITDQPYLNGAHVDLPNYPHKTALIYMNDSDGKTVIYNERWQPGYDGPFTVAQEIDAVANRMLIFDGMRYHSGTTPAKTPRRVILNVNYE